MNKILAKKLDFFVIVYLNDILIYIEDPGLVHVNAVWGVPKELKKNGFFANSKKSRFYKDKICFPGYVMPVEEV